MLFETERPQTLEQLVGRDKEVTRIKEFLQKPEGIPHLLFSGKSGTGKTTMASIIAREVFGDALKANYYEFNSSSTRGIDFIRDEIAEIAKRRPLGANYKIILLDEADGITPDAQQCLRRIMEINANYTRFIFTCNFPYKIIEPITSRCVNITFDPIDLLTIAKHLKRIVVKHKLNYTDEQIKQFAKISNGDMRLAINNLEGNIDISSSEILDTLTLSKIKTMNLDEKMSLAFSVDPELLFSKLFDLVQKEKSWDKLFPMAECNYKMNMSIHKTLFIANLLEKNF